MSKKRPKTLPSKPKKGKDARLSFNVGDSDRETISWHLGGVDLEGPFGISSLFSGDRWENVWKRIKSFETMTWSEVVGDRNHSVSLESFSKKAMCRLKEIEREDIEELFSFCIDGKGRLWGKRVNNVCKLLWWDPEHEVCPSYKKHT